MNKKMFILIGVLFMAFCTGKETTESAVDTKSTETPELTKIELLGKRIFFDTNLSEPPGQSCAGCHAPQVGWTGPIETVNNAGSVHEGAVTGRFGNRKPPSAAYAGLSPTLHLEDDEEIFVGGMFWDGRATGKTLGDPLAEQAMGPFLNPLEQNNPDKKSVVVKVKNSDYAALFEEVWGQGSLDVEEDVEGAYEKIARSIAAFERSTEVNPYSSKFDVFWHKAKSAGKKVESIDASNWQEYKNLGLTDEEVEGLMLFATKGKCANCHVLTSGPSGEPPDFTDFTYDNLGVPKNTKNSFYTMPAEWNTQGAEWVDRGLGGFLETKEEYTEHASDNYGKHKVPTLRNVDLRPAEGFVKAYFHNGFAKSLKDVVCFYNTWDIKDWPAPEVKENVNKEELGDLGLSEQEEDLVVLLMKTLSDGFISAQEKTSK